MPLFSCLERKKVVLDFLTFRVFLRGTHVIDVSLYFFFLTMRQYAN